MATTPHEAATKARIQLKGYWKTISPSRQNLRTQSVAEPDLPRTPDSALSTPVIGCDLPGPMSRDDDEDSSPFVFALDLAEHTRCSNYDMTTFGHEEATLTHNWWLGAHAPAINCQLTGTTEGRINAKILCSTLFLCVLKSKSRIYVVPHKHTTHIYCGVHMWGNPTPRVVLSHL